MVEDEISAIRDCESLILSVGRAFYNDESVLVLETLVNEKYLKEEDMGRRLHMSERQARRAMQYLEQERLVRSETVSDSKKSDVYWYVDLAMFRDVVKYRLHLTRKGAGENERRATASLTFKCANCGTRRPLADAAKYKFKCPEPDCVEDGWDLKEEAVNVSLVQAQRLVAKIQDQLSSTTDRTGIYELLARIENKKLPSNRPSENRAVGLGGTPIFADCSTTATVTTRSQAAAAHTSSFSGSAPALFSKNLQGQEILVDFDDRDDEIEWEEGVVSSSSSSSSEEEDY